MIGFEKEIGLWTCFGDVCSLFEEEETDPLIEGIFLNIRIARDVNDFLRIDFVLNVHSRHDTGKIPWS